MTVDDLHRDGFTSTRVVEVDDPHCRRNPVGRTYGSSRRRRGSESPSCCTAHPWSTGQRQTLGRRRNTDRATEQPSSYWPSRTARNAMPLPAVLPPWNPRAVVGHTAPGPSSGSWAQSFLHGSPRCPVRQAYAPGRLSASAARLCATSRCAR
jgi:hypothetical protein